MDFIGGPTVIKGLWKRSKRSKRSEDVVLLALKMEEDARSQRMR